MLRNYIKTIFRGFRKNSTYTGLNILGLATGFACVLYISLYINHEISYDKFLPDYDKIYRLSAKSYALTSPAQMEYLTDNLSGVQSYTYLLNSGNFTLGNSQTKIIERKAYYASADFFNIFQYQVLAGSYEQFDETPNATVITEQLAKTLFGDRSAINKEVTIYQGEEASVYSVVAVLKNLPSNTHMPFNMVAHMPRSVLENQKDRWGYTIYHGYLRMENEVSSAEIQAKADRVFAQRAIDQNWFKDITSVDEVLADEKIKTSQPLMRLDKIHLNSNLNFELKAGGNRQYLWVFGGTALFVLLLAAINFVNLATAQSARRAKEVGVRKTLGSTKGSLIIQFLSESIAMCLIASLLSVGLVEFLISFMQTFVGVSLSISLVEQPIFLIFLIGIAIVTGVFGGLYPAFYLTSFKPAKVLKGNLIQHDSKVNFRNVLVVFQFAVSMCLAIFMFFIHNQLNYGLQKDAGFNKENLVTIDNSRGQLGSNVESFKNSLLNDTRFVNAGYFNFELLSMNMTFISPVRNDYEVEPLRVYYQWVDHSYLPTLDVEFVSGRNFDKNIAADTAGMIINETAARKLGMREPLGEYLNFGGSPGQFKIIGIIKDIHHQSFNKKVAPTLFAFSPLMEQQMTIRLAEGSVSAGTDKLKETWKSLTDQPLDYHFVDQEFAKLFEKEAQLSKIITLFTGLASFVACLGLLGLAGYTVEQKTKEIGIRKVLGATVTQILTMFSRRFATLVIIALLFAIPAAYYITSQWLESFAYRVDISWKPFLIVGISTMLVVLFTVGYHMTKAAIANPVDTLKDE